MYALLAVLMFAMPVKADASSVKMFENVDLNTIKLTEKQERIYKRILLHPTTVVTQVIKINEKIFTCDSKTTIVLHTFPDSDTIDVTLIRDYIRVIDGKNRRFNWKTKNASESVYISVTGKSATGLFYINGKVYSLESLAVDCTF